MNFYDQENYRDGTAFLIGNEGNGLTDELTEQAVSAVSDLDQDGFLTALAESLTERTK